MLTIVIISQSIPSVTYHINGICSQIQSRAHKNVTSSVVTKLSKLISLLSTVKTAVVAADLQTIHTLPVISICYKKVIRLSMQYRQQQDKNRRNYINLYKSVHNPIQSLGCIMMSDFSKAMEKCTSWDHQGLVYVSAGTDMDH